MKFLPFLALAALTTTPAFAEDARHLDAHEHGVGQLNIAIEGAQIAMELHASGADIVGFEYAAENDQDRAAIETALGILSAPLALFALSDTAGCSVTEAVAGLEADEHEDHDDAHKEEHHDDLDHDHDTHDEVSEAGHTEFHAEYLLTCTNTSAITEISFGYFDQFPNALEVEVQIISDNGALSFEVERDEPVLDLRNL